MALLFLKRYKGAQSQQIKNSKARKICTTETDNKKKIENFLGYRKRSPQCKKNCDVIQWCCAMSVKLSAMVVWSMEFSLIVRNKKK